MPRPVSIDRPAKLHTSLRESVRAQLDAYLWSPAEDRVPVGAYQKFFEERILEFLGFRTLDLHPYGFPPGYFVRGPREMIEKLQLKLEEE